MKLENYKQRIIDEKISFYLTTFSSILIEGPKWCGKTWTSKNNSNSEIMLSDPKGNFNNKKLRLDVNKVASIETKKKKEPVKPLFSENDL